MQIEEKYIKSTVNKYQQLLVFIILCALLLPLTARTQDLHFSQYFANPISFNPAHTGFFDGSYRLGVNHKQQWPWAINGKLLNYNTSAAYADFSFLDKKINDLDWAGIGFNFINDQAGDGNLTANKAYLSLAYHKGLDREHKHFLSFGFSLGYVHRNIDFSQLFFNNQWVDRVGFDLSLPSRESYFKEQTSYLDLGIGLNGKNQISDKFGLNYGFSLLHFNRPRESFYQQINQLGMRTLIQVGTEYDINDMLDLNTSFYFTTQKKANELLFASMLGVNFNNNPKEKISKIYLGASYRLNDAISPIFGYQFHKTRVLLNYDINLSSLSKASRGNGGFELSLVQIGTFKKKKNFNYKTHCPSF
jgi:type IX secretion system PorP/SprF family membrane protein